MEEWIKKSDAIEVIKKNHYRLLGRGLTEELMIEQIKAIPSVDRQPGMWELVPCTDLSEYFVGVKYGFRYRCSNCKDERRWNTLENYCPNCGARMKGADDD